MNTYLMFGKYSTKAVGKITAARTKQAATRVAELGGKYRSGYALLGDKDLVLIVEFPGTAEAMKASVALSQELGISFSTTPAVSVDDFDKLFKTQ
jgi:uncharacterized protein with GYD domain